ncbi:Dehydration-responsive element-binding protein 1F [Morella rubra]|uniref:Dehydration-responsive element-binding protein 1F n=1 Tax=Morella rubra TaxID=262757 RepID=A0A6A1VWP3_9ROSI|nr:Dehydration-responsive element-binding protein 1F [Morella rubra]
MDIFSQFSDPHPFGSDRTSIDKPETSPLSDEGSSSHRAARSDEEVILALSRPKKRAGRRIVNVTRHPVYHGVRRRNKNKWVCEVREPNKTSRIWLGTYPTAEMAARAHDVAVLALRKRSGCLNFADSVWRLPMPGSSDPKDIRRAAAEAAEVFRPREFGGDHCGCDVEKSSQKGGEMVEEVKAVQENAEYVDEEALFDMPGLLLNMAEGLLLSPPRCVQDDINLASVEGEAEASMSLWSFSF